MTKDVLGQALEDYYRQQKPGKLWIHNRYGPKEEMPVEIYFRQLTDMPELETTALQLCKGAVLDVGAGAGAHSLALQQMGLPVTALDISQKAMQVAQMRGVNNVITADIFSYQQNGFDTLLLMMNGIGLTGSIKRLNLFLQHAKTLLNQGGQIIFDSSDISYLYKRQPKPKDRYFGEIEFRYEYKKQKTDWFNWLYVDADTITTLATSAGWNINIIMDDGYDQYLAQLTLK